MTKTKKTKKTDPPHYVCTGGCGLTSNNPQNCTSRGCYRFRNPLTFCNCQNKKHGDLPTKNVPRD